MTKELYTDIDPLSAYLDQIGQFPLLAKDKEIELARQSRAGDIKASQELASSHLRWVVTQAMASQGKGLPLQDLIQAGNLGLMTAIERFDPERGTRLLTYATPWIQRIIQQAVANAHTIRIPGNRLLEIRDVRRIQSDQEPILGRPPTPEEIAQIMEVSTQSIQEILRAESLQLSSLDNPITTHTKRTFVDFLADPDPLPEKAAEQKDLKERLRQAFLTVLTPKQRRVLELRFGLEDGIERTLEEVGREFNTTRENIRQIEARALRRLHSYFGVNQPSDYLT